MYGSRQQRVAASARLVGLALFVAAVSACASSGGSLERLKGEERNRIANACVKDVRQKEFLGWKRYGNPAELQAACWRYAKATVR
jgi:hypothetical protein